MSARAKVVQLPREVREWLDAALAERNFSGYQALEAELRARGYAIGKSSIHRYGANLERKLAAIRASTEAARMIAQQAPDDSGQREAAVMAMVSADIFDMLVALREAEDEDDPLRRAKLLATLAKNVATLSRASVAQKRHEIELRARAEAAAGRVATLAQKGGLSEDTVETIRREILGLAAPAQAAGR